MMNANIDAHVSCLRIISDYSVQDFVPGVNILSQLVILGFPLQFDIKPPLFPLPALLYRLPCPSYLPIPLCSHQLSTCFFHYLPCSTGTGFYSKGKYIVQPCHWDVLLQLNIEPSTIGLFISAATFSPTPLFHYLPCSISFHNPPTCPIPLYSCQLPYFL